MNVNHLVKQRLLCQPSCMLNVSRSGWFDRKRRQFIPVSDKEDPTFFSETQPNPVQDIEDRIQKSMQKLKWRQSVQPKATFLSESLRLLAPERTQHFFEAVRRPFDRQEILKSLNYKKHQLLVHDQRFMKDRHGMLGNDLATAHFLVARGGQVRFTRSKEWVKKNKNDEYSLPGLYDGDYIIDAIKCDGMELVYEGLENIRRLNGLRYLSFRNVKLFDDWHMDRICGNQFDTIEILDLTGTQITANALYAVPKLRSLKAIVLETTDRSIEFQLACSLLEEAMPNLRILNSADVHDDVFEAEKKQKERVEPKQNDSPA